MSKPKKVNKLSDLSIDEVSLVDRGANQHAKVLIHKRHEDEEGEALDPDDVEKMDPDLADVHVEGDDENEDVPPPDAEEPKVEKNFFSRLVSKLFDNSEEELTTWPYSDGTLTDMSDDVTKAHPTDPNRMAQIPYGMAPQGAPAPGPQGFMPQQAQAFPVGGGQPPMGAPAAMPGQAPGVPGQPGIPGQELPGQMQAGPPLPAEVIQYIQQLEQALAEQQGEESPPGDEEEANVNPFGKMDDTLDEDEFAFLQELSKNLEDEDTREAVEKALEAVEKANERATEAESIAKAERDHRLTQEFVSKARSYVNLPVSAEEFGPVLKRLNETMSEEDVQVIEKALSAANESIANAGVFTEVGKRGIDGYETVSKVDAEAKALVEKNEGLTMEQARERVLEQNPSLYDEFLQETGR